MVVSTNKQDILEHDYALLHASHRKLKREHEELQDNYLATLERHKVAVGVLSGLVELEEVVK